MTHLSARNVTVLIGESLIGTPLLADVQRDWERLCRWLPYVPDHFAQYSFCRDGAKLSTVDAVLLSPGDVDLVFVRRNGLHLLNHRAIRLVSEGDDVSLSGLREKIGDFGHQHKIPILIQRQQAVARHLKKSEHYRSG